MSNTTRLLAYGLIPLVLVPGVLAAQAYAVPDSLPPGVTLPMLERGREIFEGVGGCANCHGPLAGGLIGPNLTDSEWWHAEGSYLAIMRRVMTGVPLEESTSGIMMPPMGGARLSDDDVQAVAAYVWTLGHPHAADSLPAGVTPATVERGKVVFQVDGNCAMCHGADAAGNVGPDLTDEEWLHVKGSYLAILQSVLMGVTSENSKSGIEMPPRGGANLSDADVHAVAAYVWVLSRQPVGR